MSKKPSPLDTILARAAELRAAGITSLTLDGVAVTLAPAEPTMPDAAPRACSGAACSATHHVAPCPLAPPEDNETPDNPMQDAATYGGGRVPGFQKPKKEGL